MSVAGAGKDVEELDWENYQILATIIPESETEHIQTKDVQVKLSQTVQICHIPQDYLC